MAKRKTAKRKNPARTARPKSGRLRVRGRIPPKGYCPVCGRTDIPRGPKLAVHLESHDLSLDIDDNGISEYTDAADRFEPGVKEYRRFIKKAFVGAMQINELIRLSKLKDRRKDVTKPQVRKVRWDAVLGRLVPIG